MITLLPSGCLQMQVAGAEIHRETMDGAAAPTKLCLTAIYNISRSRRFCRRTQAQLAHIKQLQVSFYFRSTKIFNKSALPALHMILHSHICNFTSTKWACRIFFSFLIQADVCTFLHGHQTPRLQIFQSGLSLKLYSPQLINGSVNQAARSAAPVPFSIPAYSAIIK